MDHLPHPQDAVLPRVIVPYYDMYKYDGLSFTEYPVRCGFDKTEFRHGEFTGIPSTDQNSFFQAWLFFGLIHEFFGVISCESIDDDFIDHHDQGPRVTTARLPDWVKVWERAVDKLPQSKRKSECERLSKCLWEAKSVILVLDAAGTRRRPGSHLSGKVALSIIVLGLTLDRMRSYISPSGVLDKPRRSLKQGYSWPISWFARKRLEAAGWCKSEVSRLGEFMFTSGMLYCGSMRRFAIGKTIDHSGCSEAQCAALNIDEGTYKTAHADGCKGCEHDGPNVLHVKSVLAKKSFPVIELTKSETTSDIGIKVLSYCEPMPYTAISHVWADGLGNPHANTLPKCQILRLYQLLESNNRISKPAGMWWWWWYLTPNLAKTPRRSRPAGMWKKNTVYLWMDTLCVPTHDVAFRRKAISLMYDVYSKAETTFVLDGFLLSISSERHTEDLFYGITASPWMGRAWTFQEGKLAKSLCVQFADRAIILDEAWIMSQYFQTAFNDITQTILESGVPILNLLRSEPNDHDEERSHLRNVHKCLRFRSTSRSEDKLLCYAIMLRLNLDPIMKVKGDSRTLEVYQQLKDIPFHYLWHHTPRLDIPGFRWAPKDIFSVIGIYRTGEGPELVLSDRKLLFRAPGIVCFGRSCYMPDLDHFVKDFIAGKWYVWHWLIGERYDGAVVKFDAPWTALAVIIRPESSSSSFDQYLTTMNRLGVVIRLDWDPILATPPVLSNYICSSDTISGEYLGRGAIELCNQTISDSLEQGKFEYDLDLAEAIHEGKPRLERLPRNVRRITGEDYFKGEMRGSEQKWCVT